MYSHKKRAINLANTAILISLFYAPAAQANVYQAPETKPGVLMQHNTPAQVGPLRTTADDGARILAWLPPARLSTTLQLASDGLAPLASTAFAALAAPGLAAGVAEAPAHEAAEGLPSAQDRITTASIPAAAAGNTVGRAVSTAIRQDLPLFGAHRIRFGKIMSGARISGLIRKAASTGASAICINQCAGLADRLDLGGADITAQLRHVSASVNGMVAYRTDEENHGRLDQWSTPNETLARASGDCEDYAILKMAVLARLGVPVTAMEIVVVKDTSRRLFHAVLSVALEDRTLILDNMTDAVEADTRKPGYAPLFSLSGTANYIFGYKGGKQNLTASLKNIAAIAPGAGF